VDRDVEAVALLAEPVRRALYRCVVERGEVGRDEAARALGISRALAAFHLDRLAEAGLLDVRYRRLTGRSGPGAGRPAKLYRRAEAEFRVSLPERRYDLLARLLAAGLPDRADPAALRDAARGAGEEVGRRVARRGGRAATRLRRALADEGFEPFAAPDGSIRLRTCPFRALAVEDPDLVCRVNLWFLEGLVAGAGVGASAERVDPGEPGCCVALRAPA
jgi:predicted ArsR family transcriptional regulator